MTAAHSIVVSVGLFALTFLSPGPNLLIVLQSSLAHGRGAGIAAGFGVAVADGVYAALGLLGMAAVIAQSGELVSFVRIAGGLYLLWLAYKLIRRHPTTDLDAPATGAPSNVKPFVRGMTTGLTNPQTMLFFASIFAVTLTADTPAWARIVAWLGIVTTSIVWRVFLSVSFSHERVRAAYRRGQSALECFAGVVLAGFGLKLLAGGLRP